VITVEAITVSAVLAHRLPSWLRVRNSINSTRLSQSSVSVKAPVCISVNGSLALPGGTLQLRASSGYENSTTDDAAVITATIGPTQVAQTRALLVALTSGAGACVLVGAGWCGSAFPASPSQPSCALQSLLEAVVVSANVSASLLPALHGFFWRSDGSDMRGGGTADSGMSSKVDKSDAEAGLSGTADAVLDGNKYLDGADTSGVSLSPGTAQLFAYVLSGQRFLDVTEVVLLQSAPVGTDDEGDCCPNLPSMGAVTVGWHVSTMNAVRRRAAEPPGRSLASSLPRAVSPSGKLDSRPQFTSGPSLRQPLVMTLAASALALGGPLAPSIIAQVSVDTGCGVGPAVGGVYCVGTTTFNASLCPPSLAAVLLAAATGTSMTVALSLSGVGNSNGTILGRLMQGASYNVTVPSVQLLHTLTGLVRSEHTSAVIKTQVQVPCVRALRSAAACDCLQPAPSFCPPPPARMPRGLEIMNGASSYPPSHNPCEPPLFPVCPIPSLHHHLSLAKASCHHLCSLMRPQGSVAMVSFSRALNVPNVAMPLSVDAGQLFLALDVCSSLEAATGPSCSLAQPCGPGCVPAAFVSVVVADDPGPISHLFHASVGFIFSDVNTVCVVFHAPCVCAFTPLSSQPAVVAPQLMIFVHLQLHQHCHGYCAFVVSPSHACFVCWYALWGWLFSYVHVLQLCVLVHRNGCLFACVVACVRAPTLWFSFCTAC
jgi:hypothetical protein